LTRPTIQTDRKIQTMTRLASTTIKTLRLLPRAVLIVAALAAPVLAMPLSGGEQTSSIEAPGLKKTGAGFVLLMSLQRG
jgi:hypothetical protein